MHLGQHSTTQPCIPPESLNQVSGVKATPAGWQVTLCDFRITAISDQLYLTYFTTRPRNEVEQYNTYGWFIVNMGHQLLPVKPCLARKCSINVQLSLCSVLGRVSSRGLVAGCVDISVRSTFIFLVFYVQLYVF